MAYGKVFIGKLSLLIFDFILILTFYSLLAICPKIYFTRTVISAVITIVLGVVPPEAASRSSSDSFIVLRSSRVIANPASFGNGNRVSALSL